MVLASAPEIAQTHRSMDTGPLEGVLWCLAPGCWQQQQDPLGLVG